MGVVITSQRQDGLICSQSGSDVKTDDIHKRIYKSLFITMNIPGKSRAGS